MSYYNKKLSERFPGFQQRYDKDYFKYPIVLESYWCQLTGAEQKALDFILRQTYGYQKTADKISISQFVHGIGKKNKGAGISKAQVPRVLKSLEGKGFIVTSKTRFRTTEISLARSNDDEELVTPISEVSDISPAVSALIEMFREVSPHQVDSFKTSRRQMEAISELVKFYGFEKVGQVIQILNQVNGKAYAPTIISPVDLKEKWTKLLAYILKKKDSENNGFKISF